MWQCMPGVQSCIVLGSLVLTWKALGTASNVAAVYGASGQILRLSALTYLQVTNQVHATEA